MHLWPRIIARINFRARISRVIQETLRITCSRSISTDDRSGLICLAIKFAIGSFIRRIDRQNTETTGESAAASIADRYSRRRIVNGRLYDRNIRGYYCNG